MMLAQDLGDMKWRERHARERARAHKFNHICRVLLGSSKSCYPNSRYRGCFGVAHRVSLFTHSWSKSWVSVSLWSWPRTEIFPRFIAEGDVLQVVQALDRWQNTCGLWFCYFESSGFPFFSFPPCQTWVSVTVKRKSMKLNKHENNATNPFTWKGDKQCLTHIMIGSEIGLALIMNKTNVNPCLWFNLSIHCQKEPFFFYIFTVKD